ncbi:MAG: archaemetzincin [Planctomycetota bacterium]
MRRRTFLTFTSFGVAQCLGRSFESIANPKHETGLVSLQAVLKAKSQILPLHEKKKPNQPGDWLEQHKETGQSFDEFMARKKGRVCQQYRAIYIQPLGEFSKSQRAVVVQTEDFMARFFGMPVELLPDKSLADLPEQARRVHPTWNVSQVLSTHLLDHVLKPLRPKDAVAVLGLTAEDLWPGQNWNFVFGQASLSDRVGVWSLHRNGNVDGSFDEKRLFLRRTLKTAAHETGHMLGIPHCVAFECGMNGSNNLSESDRQPLEFCPECQAKISWTCSCSLRTRYQKLAEFGRRHELHDDVECWTRSQAVLTD